ncbi:unnamed protein product [Brassica rapa]|uniref:Zinc finger PMZ-type domain-containing protein n=2 Tax=Brassica TaxID=3705 RepID=A0A3P5Z6F4_BRACM|nr:unnamed protein product [Brassica napus]CAG7888296.1 unnamed protein product [Brassica rapa]CDY29742.1 BnaA01g19240D [Brassica napus]VDC75726.1 unnamed protein product [Brassica rapa]
MGRLVRLVIGLWSKSPTEVWSFEEAPNSQREAVIINRTESIDGLVEMIRITLNLGILTPVVLTYQLPTWMLVPDGPTTPPITLVSNKDVEIMASVFDYMADPVLYVTSGPELVAKYQFFCRTPFSIDEKTYLEEGVTEEQHRQAIIDLVGSHPIVCSKHILEIMFNEPQLLLVFRVALEIEMVYGLQNDVEDTNEGLEYNNLTGNDFMALEGSVPLSPDPLNNYDPNQEEGRRYEVYIAPSPHPAERVIGLPLAQNRRDFNETQNYITIPPPPVTENSDYTVDVNSRNAILPGEPSAEVKINNKGKKLLTENDLTPTGNTTDVEPFLDLTLGVGVGNSKAEPEPVIDIQESSSEAEDGSGGFAVGNGRLTPRVNEILEGNFENSGGMLVRRINNVEFEVKDKVGSSYHVNLCGKTFSCFSFQKLLIPCSHAIASAINEKVRIESLVSDFYSLETLTSAYAEDIVPITTETEIREGISGKEGEPVIIFPPSSRRPPGRPRKSRILSTGEIRVSKTC